ncbi:MAG TPA: hypothetical protein VF145_02395 [Chitinophagaceae bacterium]
MKPKGNQTPAKQPTAAEPDRSDLQDSPRDEARLQPDEATIDLPDVKDIPGQEFVHPPSLGELADTTIASDDEEGVSIFGRDNEETAAMGKATESSTEPGRNRGNRDKNDSSEAYGLDEDPRETDKGTAGIP